MSDPKLSISYVGHGRSGEATVSFSIDTEQVLVDRCRVTSERVRDRLTKELCGQHPGIPEQDVRRELLHIAAELSARSSEEQDASPADRLIELASDADLFHSKGGDQAEAYASVPVVDDADGSGPPRQITVSVPSRGFRRWLLGRYYERFQSAPNSQAVAEAIDVVAAKALFQGAEHDVGVRMGGDDDSIFVDLADPECRIVRIGASGWTVIPAAGAPVKLTRRPGMLALPEPVRGGGIDDIRPLLNVENDDDWVLLVAFVVGVLRPAVRPFPILCVSGEQGSAKSTLCKLVRKLVDPHQVPLRRPPRNEQDLMIGAANNHLLALDNLSTLSPSMSDAICSLATGGGFACRALYSNAEEWTFGGARPLLLNGIVNVAKNSDLNDRAIGLCLPTIQDQGRMEEKQIHARFREVHAGVLGALFDAVAAALANREEVKLAKKPRMADFATFVVKAEPRLPWEPGRFLEAYGENRANSHIIAVEESAFGQDLVRLIDEKDHWEGTATQLLEALAGGRDKKDLPEGWPKKPQLLSSLLRRLAPDLRALGYDVVFPKRSSKARVIRLRKTCDTASSASPASQPAQNGREQPPSDDARGFGASSSQASSDSGHTGGPNGESDGDDARDALSHPPGDPGKLAERAAQMFGGEVAEWDESPDLGADLS